MTSFHTILSKLSALGSLVTVQKGGKAALAQCPAHDDRNQSLSVGQNFKGDALLKCHAGCETPAVVVAMGLTMADLFTDGGGAPPAERACEDPTPRPTTSTIVCTYDYRDEAGELLNQVVRMDPKSFRQRRPVLINGVEGGWQYNLDGVRRVVYRLPELKRKKAIVLVEGEKDADALWSLKPPIPATTTLGGSSAWRDEYVQQLVSAGVKRLAIIPDNDDAGRKYAQRVAADCHRAGIVVRVVSLPGMPDKGDVSDFLSVAENPRGDLIRLIAEAPEWTPEAEPLQAADKKPHLKYVRLSEVEAKKVEWLWKGRIPLGMLTLIAGDAGGGKSFLSEFIASCLSQAKPWPDGEMASADPSPTVFLAAEDSLAEVTRPRADAMGADTDQIIVITSVVTQDGKDRMVSLKEDLALIAGLIRETRARAVVIDPVNAYLGGKTDNYKDPEVRAVLTPLVQMAAEHRIAVLGIMHLSKAAQAQVIYRIGGSVAFAALARAVFFVSRDPNDPNLRLWTNPKMSVAKEADTRGFRIVSVPGSDSATLEWLPDPIDVTAAEAMKAPESKPAKSNKSAEAAEWLVDFLKEGPRGHKDVLAAGSEMGYSLTTLNRAKKILKNQVVSRSTTDEKGRIAGHVWELLTPVKESA